MSGPPISEFFDMMPDTVTIDAWVSYSVSGVPRYAGTPRTYRAYIEMKNHRVIDGQGREVLAKGRVFMGTNVVCDVKDKVTLPAEYVPRTPPIIAVNVVSDDEGNHHTTLEIG